ncbi:hypothetical protein HY416_02115 [Candidatus Kaiserbacteria bacterium]|nr:hypothetical protein [Candidatus Kaiserbacteria bacterium]
MDNLSTPAESNSRGLSRATAVLITLVPLALIAGYVLHPFFPIRDLLGIGDPPDNLPPPVATTTPLAPPVVPPRPEDLSGFTVPVTFTTGRPYILEEFLLVADEPNVMLSGYVTRAEREDGIREQRTSAYLYNDGVWTEDSAVTTTQEGSVRQDAVVTSWSDMARGSLVLEERLAVSFSVRGEPVSFTSGVMTNEMGIRSLPSHTRFQSEGTADVVIGGKTYKARLLFVRTFSNNVAETSFLNLGYYNNATHVTTDWVADWDDEGNFFFVDVTDVRAIAIPHYTSHRIGFYKDGGTGIVQRTFDVTVEHDKEEQPSRMTVSFGAPIGKTMTFSVDPVRSKTRTNVFKAWMYAPIFDETGGRLRGILQHVYN